MRVQLRFAVDEDARELPVPRKPGVVELALEDVRADDVCNRAEEVVTNDRVVTRDDVQGRVLLGDPLDDRQDRRKIFDVLRVREHCACKRIRLVSGLSVCEIIRRRRSGSGWAVRTACLLWLKTFFSSGWASSIAP